jgi:hypothetical protein
MKYLSAEQTPIVQNNLIVAWTLRVRAEEGGVEATLEEHVDIPEAERVEVTAWTLTKMQDLITKVSEERNMLFRAAQMVFDKKASQ